MTYFWLLAVLATVPHLRPVGKARAAAAAQAAPDDGLDDVLGRHFVQRVVQGLVAVRGDVGFDAFGVDDAAVGEDDGQLLGEERRWGSAWARPVLPPLSVARSPGRSSGVTLM